MKSGRETYQEIAATLLSKYQPLYDVIPWDDPFNDTKFGSRELDCLVYDALSYGTIEENAIIKSFIEATANEKSIAIAYFNVSDSVWKEKVFAAQVLLDQVDSFVEAVLAYYNRTKH
jgi:hypothetical protein